MSLAAIQGWEEEAAFASSSSKAASKSEVVAEASFFSTRRMSGLLTKQPISCHSTICAVVKGP